MEIISLNARRGRLIEKEPVVVLRKQKVVEDGFQEDVRTVIFHEENI